MILAGVSISLILDNNGIIQRSKDAREQYGQARDNEQSQLEDVSGWIDEITDNIDWDKILNKVAENPEDYKHPDQKSTNPDIGIGTDGKPVNMDLWYYKINGEKSGVVLNNGSVSATYYPGYDNAKITEEGTIVGKMPQFIYNAEDDEIYPVTSLEGTFFGCTNLKKVPAIPTSVTNMYSTFSGCTSLKTVPEIPSKVTDMHETFYRCTSLTGNLIINANPTNYSSCLTNAATADDANLVVSGSSTVLDEIIATKSDNSHITKGN